MDKLILVHFKEPSSRKLAYVPPVDYDNSSEVNELASRRFETYPLMRDVILHDGDRYEVTARVFNSTNQLIVVATKMRV